MSIYSLDERKITAKSKFMLQKLWSSILLINSKCLWGLTTTCDFFKSTLLEKYSDYEIEKCVIGSKT